MNIDSSLIVLSCAAALSFGPTHLTAQEGPGRNSVLDRVDYKNGSATLRLFASAVTEALPHVVQFEQESKPLALGAIITEAGGVITKASEVKNVVFTAKLADGRTLPARLVAVDNKNDVGLVQIDATGLTPIRWTAQEPAVGQWTVTPGTDPTPEAVGIVSVPPRKIQHRRAFIGIELDFRAALATIVRPLPGLGAERVGLRQGDVILALNGVPIENSQALTQKLRAYWEGQTVALHIQRDSGHFEVSIELGYLELGADREVRMNRMGSELSTRAEGFQQAIQHDTVLQSWQCGGPLLNLDGEVIGLNIARAGRVATYALPAALVEQIAQTLLAEQAGRP